MKTIKVKFMIDDDDENFFNHIFQETCENEGFSVLEWERAKPASKKDIHLAKNLGILYDA